VKQGKRVLYPSVGKYGGIRLGRERKEMACAMKFYTSHLWRNFFMCIDAVMSVLNRPLNLLNKVNGLMKMGQEEKQMAEDPSPQALPNQDKAGLVPSEGGDYSEGMVTGEKEQKMAEDGEAREGSREKVESEETTETANNNGLLADGDRVTRWVCHTIKNLV